jgi:diguanylate cyclase (GGDEF)-like protein
MQHELPFDGYKELIQDPLERNDPRSFNLIKRYFIDITSSQPNPFSQLLQRIAGKNFTNREATSHWRHILTHKNKLESRLERNVGIQVAALDYFDSIGLPETAAVRPMSKATLLDQETKEDWLEKVYTPGYHLEKLKEEILRAKRYKHALSAIMLDVDEFRKINERFSYEVGDKILTLIVKIIKKLIRNVDIITRYSGDRFFIILPNTNKREAKELADRLKEKVNYRTKRLEGLADGVTLTLSVGQCNLNDASAEFMKHLENLLIEGKKIGRNAVYTLE